MQAIDSANNLIARVHSGEGLVILRNSDTGHWLRFSTPNRIVTARQLKDVIPALETIESEVESRNFHAAGFIGYEAAGAFDPALCTHASGDFPMLWFGLYPEPTAFEMPAPDFNSYILGEWTPSVSKTEYRHAIEAIKERIASGDTYQVNYTLRLRVPFRGDPWHLFLAMVRAQEAGYEAWLDIGRYAVCSASPEMFFRLQGNHLTCKPMKGTVARGRTLDEDKALALWLSESEKNRAENLMIVDMIRNDLGRIADVGSVQTPRLFEVERHPTLWQMTSTVTATSQKPVAALLGALFPCASITGAPKVRTTHIISELETGPRGIYTGCIGYIAPKRYAQFSVAIRTAVVDRESGQVEYGSGGGIVWDSASDDEYDEALLKARVLTLQRPEFSLFETILWTRNDAYFLLEYHLERLKNSAAYFDFAMDMESVKYRLDQHARSLSGNRQRVRLLLHKGGHIDIESTPLDTEASIPPVRVKIARNPVDSSDVFLYHKTTERGVYEDALSRCSDCDDVLLWNQRGELTESTVANVVVEINGRLFTPPVNSGLLAGTFRASLLDQGRIHEHVIKIEDLNERSKIYLINSVRRWRESVLI